MVDTTPDTHVHLFAGNLQRWLGGRSKTSLAVSSVICFAIFWFLGHLADVPTDRDFNGSLLSQTSPLLAIFITAIAVLACTLLMSVIQSHGEVEDPLLAIGMGLSHFLAAAARWPACFSFHR